MCGPAGSCDRQSQLQIQCPDCGKVLTKSIGYDELYCSKCKKFFSETEIRKRCGI